MHTINPQAVQELLDELRNEDIYFQLEMTTGAYAAHRDSSKFTASTFVSNSRIRYTQGAIAGSGPYRVGLKTETSWIYSEGLTHWAPQQARRLTLAGHDAEGKLVVGLQLSREPFL
ncbi:YojF family protein [Paenibacillus sp. y28]|uniref:YojF family protein n=1 Tax=Paenibacillus sp. y28 TaxID=3129110 RepID=UPI003017AD2D